MQQKSIGYTALLSLVFLLSCENSFSESIVYSGRRIDPLSSHVLAYSKSPTAIGDINGNGTPDIALLTRDAADLYKSKLVVFDGATAWNILPPRSIDDIVYHANRDRASVVALGDVNGDGLPDFALGSPEHFSQNPFLANRGAIRVFNGDGTELYTLRGAAAEKYLGDNLAAPGDLSGDGVPDLVSCTSFDASSFPVPIGQCSLLDGSNGNLIQTFTSGDAGFGAHVQAIPDMNGDGKNELVVAAQPGRSGIRHSVFVIDGNTRAVLYARHFPSSVQILDMYALTGDGRLSSKFAISSPGSLRIFEVTGNRILEHYSLTKNQWPIKIRSVGMFDIDDDGEDELLVGYDNQTQLMGMPIDVHDGRTGVFEGTLDFGFPSVMQDGYASALNSIGDVTGDGSPELFIGGVSNQSLSFRVVTGKALTSAGIPCRPSPEDFFEVQNMNRQRVSALVPGQQVIFSGKLAGARGHVGLFIAIPGTLEAVPSYISHISVPQFGCHTIAGSYPMHLVDIPVAPDGSFELSFTVPPETPNQIGGATVSRGAHFIFDIFADSSQGIKSPRAVVGQIQ